MKIAVLCPHVEDTGGVREVVVRIAREHTAGGHRVDVIGRERTRPIEPSSALDGMTIWRVPMAPAPYRGKRNEPAYLVRTAMRLGEIVGKSIDEIGAITSANAERVFGPRVALAA